MGLTIKNGARSLSNRPGFGSTSSVSAIATSLAGLCIILVGLFLWGESGPAPLIIAPLLTLLTGLCVRDASAIAVVTFLNYSYSMGAYLGAINGITFFPWPPLTIYAQVAHEQTLALMMAFGVALLLGVGRSFQKAARVGWSTIAEWGRNGSGEMMQNRFWIVFGIAMAIGLHDLIFVASNLGSVLNSGRHTFRDEFWVGNGPFGIVLALAIGLILIVQSASSRTNRIKSLMALGIFWLPSIIAGSRNYFSVLMLGAICVTFFAVKRRGARIWLGLAAVGGILSFAWLPTLWSTNDLVGFNEWILPTSSYFPLILGLFTIQGLGATTLLNQWPLMLPGFLRPFPVELYAENFADRKFTNVGVAGNPWADAYDPNVFTRLIVFILTYVVVFVVASLLQRVHPAVPFLAFGLMAFWGRSVFWNVAIALIYAAILLRVLMPMKAKQDARA